MLDVKRIREDANCLLVAEELGIQIHQRGRRNLILCPHHDDRRIGSCFINEHRYHCYSCGYTGDAFSLVMEAEGVSFSNAVEFVANVCGGIQQYEDGEVRDGLIPVRYRKKIGLEDEPIFGLVDIEFSESEAEDYLADHPSARAEYIQDFGYIVEGMLCMSPLALLYRNSPEEYHRIIREYCDDAIASTKNLYGAVIASSKDPSAIIQRYREEMDELSFIRTKYGKGEEIITMEIPKHADIQAWQRAINDDFFSHQAGKEDMPF